MTRIDGVFHTALGATLLFGFAIAGSLADQMWEKKNEGVSVYVWLMSCQGLLQATVSSA